MFCILELFIISWLLLALINRTKKLISPKGIIPYDRNNGFVRCKNFFAQQLEILNNLETLERKSRRKTLSLADFQFLKFDDSLADSNFIMYLHSYGLDNEFNDQ